MSYLVDSNILCRLSDRNDPQHEETRKAVRALLDKGKNLFLISQVEREFWVVATRPSAQNGLNLSTEQPFLLLSEFRILFKPIPDAPGVHELWQQLVKDHDVKGKAAHDTGIVASALVHDITCILTFNTQDFDRYAVRIAAKTPTGVLTETVR